jgi:hypothetical protein
MYIIIYYKNIFVFNSMSSKTFSRVLNKYEIGLSYVFIVIEL